MISENLCLMVRWIIASPTLEGVHNWKPRLSDILCEPLFTRITREIQRTIRTVIPLDRVRAAPETARGEVRKSITVSANVSMRVGAGGVPLVPRNIEDNFVAVYLVKLLFEGGCAVASYAVKVEGRLFVPSRSVTTSCWMSPRGPRLGAERIHGFTGSSRRTGKLMSAG